MMVMESRWFFDGLFDAYNDVDEKGNGNKREG